MKLKYIYLVLMLSILFGACTTDELIDYKGEAYIYFFLDEEINSIIPEEEQITLEGSYTFIFEEDDVNTKGVEIPVSVSGYMSDADRSFTIEVVDSMTTATQGTHFSIDNAKQVIKAGETGGKAIISLNRTADMKDSIYTVGIRLTGNENFTSEIRTYYQLSFSDLLSKPDWWYRIIEGEDFYDIGEFTQQKCLHWMEYNGVTDGSDPIGHLDSFYKEGERKNIMRAFGVYLRDHPDAPLLDENGDVILETL
ncbi:DUF4843 domain-containing protein [Marinifilum sp.]|uniref:DUF4843 domain-containing protein n=1 Tax=Marinifilum sp. TaxID=2033137 RepID=UPI003BA9E0AB